MCHHYVNAEVERNSVAEGVSLGDVEAVDEDRGTVGIDVERDVEGEPIAPRSDD